MDTFRERIEELRDLVGGGDLVGAVEYDQPYAQIQHEALEFRHPQGGQSKYLEAALQEGFEGYLEAIARGVLDDGGREAMIDSMERLTLSSSEKAPIGPGGAGKHGKKIEALHPGLLRSSGHPTVKDAGRIIYDLPGALRQRDHDTNPGNGR